MRIQQVGKMSVALGFCAVLLTGCGLFEPVKESSSIDPPPATSTVLPEELAKPAGEVQKELAGKETVQGTVDRTVYLLDANGFVVPVSLALPKEQGPAKQVLTYMVQGGPVEQMLPEGFHAILPKGTTVKGIGTKNETATVDFSPEFRKYQAKDEKKIIEAITRSLTEFPAIQKVSIWVNGTPLQEMPVNSTPVSSTLDRATGINLEFGESAIPGRTTSVTIYFEGQLNDQRSYYVPVTRLIPRTDNVAKAVVEELIKGPKEGSLLVGSIPRTTKINDIKEKDGTLVVDLSKDILRYDTSESEASPEAMESLVLSLTENTGAKKVQVLVEGKPLAKAGSLNFTKPVSRPVQINPMQF